MKRSITFPLGLLILGSAFLPLCRVQGATVASATFTGMSASDLTTIAPVTGANDFTWTLIQTPSTNLDIVTDDGSPGIGGGNALRMDNSSTSTFRGIVGTLASSITVDVGETLTLTLAGRYYETPGNNSGGLRFGLVAPGDVDNNFFAQFGTGGSTSFGLFRDIDNDDTPGSGTGVVGITSTASGPAFGSISDTNPFTAVFSVKRTGTSVYQITASLNGSTRTGTSTTGWNDYNGLFIRNGGIDDDFLIDNVAVTLVPEPSAALLAGLAGISLLRRRRDC